MSKSVLFFAVCTVLDQLSTFISLSLGGVELNLRVARLLDISPILYSLLDVGIILTAYILDTALKDRVKDVWLIWASAGIGRLVCVCWSLGMM